MLPSVYKADVWLFADTLGQPDILFGRRISSELTVWQRLVNRQRVVERRAEVWFSKSHY